jgi:hypothetical protein
LARAATPLDDPNRESIRRYLRVHINDESLVTDELVDYIRSTRPVGALHDMLDKAK